MDKERKEKTKEYSKIIIGCFEKNVPIEFTLEVCTLVFVGLLTLYDVEQRKKILFTIVKALESEGKEETKS